MALYTIRHTTVDIPKSVCYGQTDVSLNGTFEVESNAVVDNLKDIEYQSVYTSPASRCRLLAEKISKDYKVDDRLQELNFGDWEMKHWDDISDPYLFTWMENYITLPCPNGESLQAMVKRVKEFYEAVDKENGDLVVVTHAGVIRCLHHLINGVDLQELFDIEVKPGSITVF